MAACLAQFTIVSATQLRATAPHGGVGLVDIVVTNAGGSSAKSGADGFNFVSATITNGQPGSFVSSGPTLTPVANLPALPAGVTGEFPDAIGFTVGGVGLGGKVTVVIQLPAGTLQPGIIYSYEKLNTNTNTWSTFVTDNGNSVSFDVAAQQIDLTLTDGSPDDQDGNRQRANRRSGRARHCCHWYAAFVRQFGCHNVHSGNEGQLYRVGDWYSGCHAQ